VSLNTLSFSKHTKIAYQHNGALKRFLLRATFVIGKMLRKTKKKSLVESSEVSHNWSATLVITGLEFQPGFLSMRLQQLPELSV
jgi:hypothetical protein